MLFVSAFGACKKEEETPAHFGKWKITSVQEIEFEDNVKIDETTETFGLETTIMNFKDATNIDISETDASGAIIDTQNLTYKIENGNLTLTYGSDSEVFTNFSVNGNKISFKSMDYATDIKDRWEYIYTLTKM